MDFSDIRQRHPWLNVPIRHKSGWLSLLDDLACEIEARYRQAGIPIDGQSLIVRDVKEKFGTLRFYAYSKVDIQDLVAQAYERSATTCEVCGKPGSLYSGQHGLMTCCDNGSCQAVSSNVQLNQ